MEYDKYTEYFKLRERLEGGHIEMHVAFEILPSEKNPDWLEYKCSDIERRALWYFNHGYPGIRIRREGPKFWIDLVSIRSAGHLDYFDRACIELIPFFGFKPLDNQLGDPNSQTPQNDTPKNSLSSPQ